MDKVDTAYGIRPVVSLKEGIGTTVGSGESLYIDNVYTTTLNSQQLYYDIVVHGSIDIEINEYNNRIDVSTV